MDVMEAIRRRYSVRDYKDLEVEEEKLNLILEAARLAPSASNRQEWRFIVIRDKETKNRLCKAAKGQKFVAQAPIVIACCAVDTSHIMSCGQPSYPIDVAISIDHMTLKATEEGLGTCWIGAFYEDKVKEILEIPQDVRVVQLLTLGYPKSEPPPKKNRKSLDEIIMYEKWR
jgi:nitroreductase